MKRALAAATLLIVFQTSDLAAQGEHNRRAAAELRLIAGDARLLASDAERPDTHTRGLRDRIKGSLSSLNLLLRLADQETGKVGKERRETGALVNMFESNNWQNLARATNNLAISYPIVIPKLSAGLLRAKSIHSEFCAVCHDEPDLDIERPAYNLFTQARNLPAAEFYARLVIGIRGDRITGFSNPFTDLELKALLDYYRGQQL